MNVAVANTKDSQVFGDIFAVARDRLPGKGKVASARQKAFETFQRIGLPHRRLEDWKYTDLRVAMRDIAPIADAPDKAALTCGGDALEALALENAQLLVLVDGAFAPQLSKIDKLEKGLTIRALREVLESGDTAMQTRLIASASSSDPMIALNTAMMTDGVVIEIADGLDLATPLHVVHVSTSKGASAFTRSLLHLGNKAEATLVERFIAAEGADAYQVHDALVISVGDHARLDHIRLMEDAGDAFNISTALVTVGSHSHFNTFGMTSGGAVSRYQAFIECAGEYSNITTYGVNLFNGTQHGDTTLVLDHTVPNCSSREVFRSVLDDRGHSVFQGRINVHPDAQKTDAKMMTRALLLSDEAEADNKPELEIFADDVTCGHGATAGALDESLLFYLRARGLPEKEAQALLIAAFVGEAIESIVNDDLRDVAMATAERWLAARG
ncbi:MAG: Fe-S cluster assembly protein SufD [Afipia sp.]|nr:Fe-S cluster assembly protein SufD [Afipia sp.]